ncbi:MULTISPECIES: GNAT family N-acetyltransferase [Streptomyces]|uniref:GNAT family N-acetyltransferase n=1 Tax=Streptomyces TaxID=1883 RepID=UPI0016880302|nr:GNAT family N-acetyltransferase [Streptomyces venezuelae]
MGETTPPWRIDVRPDPATCARTLAAAFHREPALSWICGASQTLRTQWFDTTLRTHATLPGALRYAATTTSDARPVAAAVLTPPGAAPGIPARAAWAARTGLRCGPSALGKTLRYLHHAEALVPTGAWTLEFIGARPDSAGRGAGRFLLDHVLATAPAPAGFFLTTADPANVPLYRRFGFTELQRTVLGPLTVTAMARPGPT